MHQRDVVSAIQRGAIVLADRYTYTAFARDEARGLDREWVRNLYHFTVEPDVVFYLHINPDEAVRRRIALQQQREKLQNTQPKKHGGKEQISRRTEVLYQRLHFGTVLQDRQRTPGSLTNLDDLAGALSDGTNDGNGRTKAKKMKRR